MRLAVPAILTLLAAVGTAQTTWYVDAAATPPGTGSQASPYASLQYAIAQPTTVNGDRLEVAPGTYAEPFDFLGKAIHVLGTGGEAVTTLYGESYTGNRSVVRFESGEGRDSVLEGFTITGGIGTYDPATTEVYGGGLFLRGSSPTIRNCLITMNSSGAGCGLYGEDSSPLIVSTRVIDNSYSSGSGSGGGVAFLGGSPELERVVVEANRTSAFGGGFWQSHGRASLKDCTVNNNVSLYGGGGGVFLLNASVTLEGCTIANNLSADGGHGGGLSAIGRSRVTAIDCVVDSNIADNDHIAGGVLIGAGAQLDFFRGRITSNYASDGGGVYCFGIARFWRTTISGNTAEAFQAGSGSGGGVRGPARLLRCLITDNQARQGSSGGGDGGGTHGASLNHCTVTNNTANGVGGGVYNAPRIHNSIVWGNTPGTIGGTSAAMYSDLEGGLGGTGNISLDPLFVDPGTGDYRLQAGSPCIDAGNPASPLDPDGTRADMGAFPFGG